MSSWTSFHKSKPHWMHLYCFKWVPDTRGDLWPVWLNCLYLSNRWSKILLTRWPVIPSIFVLTVTYNDNVESSIKLFYFDPQMNSYICYPWKMRFLKSQHFNQNFQSAQHGWPCWEDAVYYQKVNARGSLGPAWWVKVWKILFFLWGGKGWNDKCQTTFSFIITLNHISHGNCSSWPWVPLRENFIILTR